MNGRMIDTDMVAQMFRDGTLWHSMDLEFSDTPGFEVPIIGKLVGYDPDSGIKFGFKRLDGFYDFAEYARFPLPDLRDGDPVWVRNSRDDEWERRVFSNKCDDEAGVWCYADSMDAWTSRGRREYWHLVGVPTPSTLESSGLDCTHFSGRRGIPQNG